MAELKSPLSGELSGHIFFADKWYGFDDGMYAAVRLLNAFQLNDGALSDLTKDLPVLYSTPEVRLEVDETQKFELVEQLTIKARMIAEAQEGSRVIAIDGIRVENEKGWWLLRASNTQNALTLRMEAGTEKNLRMIRDNVQILLRSVGLDLNKPLH